MFFANLLEKKSSDNTSNAVIQFIKQLRVPVTTSSIVETLENHPDYPSLLSICDSLNSWKIENIALNVEPESLDQLPVPFLAHTKKGGGNFWVVKAVGEEVKWLDEKGKEQNKVKQDFIKHWSGVVLLAEKDEYSGEKDFKARRKNELLYNLRAPIIIFSCLILVFFYALTRTKGNFLWPSLMLLTKLIGSIVTGLLLWFEIDKSDPILQQICSAGKNTNCTAILSSKESKLFSIISWSEIGFFYFTGGFLFLLLNTNDLNFTLNSTKGYFSAFAILSGLNLFTLPYILFSVVYQWRIAKQWCLLCMTVQVLLILEFIIGYWGRLSYHQIYGSITKGQLLILITSFLLPLFFWVATKKIYQRAQEARRYEKESVRLKYNKDIFNTLLIKQKGITSPLEELGIIIGNPEAKNTLIKVCNPYCGPCAKAHSIIEEILKNNYDLKVKIIFNATNRENDIRSLPVKHLIGLYKKNDPIITKNALNEWYNSEDKDYEAFAAKYPLSEEFSCGEAKIEEMDRWCKSEGISFTPTFFINNYRLPEIYKIDDLRFLLQA